MQNLDKDILIQNIKRLMKECEVTQPYFHSIDSNLAKTKEL